MMVRIKVVVGGEQTVCRKGEPDIHNEITTIEIDDAVAAMCTSEHCDIYLESIPDGMVGFITDRAMREVNKLFGKELYEG